MVECDIDAGDRCVLLDLRAMGDPVAVGDFADFQAAVTKESMLHTLTLLGTVVTRETWAPIDVGRGLYLRRGLAGFPPSPTRGGGKRNRRSCRARMMP